MRRQGYGLPRVRIIGVSCHGVVAHLFLGLFLTLVSMGRQRALGQEVTPEARFFDALRSRQLVGLLERGSEQLLRQRELAPDLQIKATAELATARSLRAAQNPDASARRAAWKEIDTLAKPLLDAHGDTDLGLQLKFRLAGTYLERGRVVENLGKVTPNDASFRADALLSAKAAVALLTPIKQMLDDELGKKPPEIKEKSPKNKRRAPAPKSDEQRILRLGNLSVAVDLLLGVAWVAVTRAETKVIPREDAAEVAEPLLKNYTQQFSVVPISMEAHLALAELYFWVARYNDALNLLQPFRAEKEVPPAFVARAARLQGMVLLERKKYQEAVDALLPDQQETFSDAERLLLLFEAQLKLATQLRARKGDAKEIAQREREAIEVLDKLEAQHGAYWALRGEAVLTAHGSLEAGDSYAVLRRLAMVLRRRGQSAEALTAYDRAIKAAKTEQKADASATLTHEAALLALEQKDYPGAAQRWQTLGEDYALHPLAPRALLNAAFAWAKQYAKNPQADILLKYRSALGRHEKLFSKDEATAPEVHWLLAELAERDRQPLEAIRHYQAIPAGHARHATAVLALALLWHQLNENTPNSQDVQLVSARAFLGPLLAAPPEAWRGQEAGERALAAARLVQALLLSRVPDQGEASEKLLRAGLNSRHPAPARLRGRAWRVLSEWYLARADKERAVATVREGFIGTEGELLRLLAGLDLGDDSLPAERRLIAAEVVLAAAARLLAKPDVLAANEVFGIRLLQAQAHAQRGEHGEATRLLRSLQAAAPRDPRVLAIQARVQFAAGQWNDSLKIWSLLFQGLPHGQPDWLDAAYHVGACYHRLGRAAEARRAVSYLDRFYPQAGSPSFRAKLDSLRQALKENQETP